MDLFSSMRVSSSGIDAQMKRMNTISSNIANAETTRTPEGGPYRKKDILLASQTDRESFGEILENHFDEHVMGVQVVDIVSDPRAPRLVYNPHHPDADALGYVAMPNVNPVEELANMISTERAFEANITALNTSKSMAQKALELGK